MADALISPAVGGSMWAASAAATVYCAKRIRKEADSARVPLMGVAGAFVFAAQMVNFTIPGTGSSGHLGGGLLLAVLLGPEAAFIVMASVLAIQAFFFADGGLLALGANIFNLGVFPAFIAYPLVYRRIAGAGSGQVRRTVASVAAALLALTLGALGVVLETTASGVSSLPFAAFAAAMVPIHLAIGLVEGLVTAAVLTFVRRAQPELLEGAGVRGTPASGVAWRVVVGLAVAALVAGGVLSWFASSHPDGLEWSVAKVTGSAEPTAGRGVVERLAAAVQDKTALMPDYAPRPATQGAGSAGSRPPGDGLPGVIGGAVVIAIVAGAGAALARRARRSQLSGRGNR